MPSWLIGTFTVVSILLLFINTILLLLILAHVEVRRRKEERKGGGRRDWSWYDKRNVWALEPRNQAVKLPQEKENKNGYV